VKPVLAKMVGAHREFRPMYPNFPNQVMEASEAELWFNAMANYFGFHLSDLLGDPNLVVLPQYEKEVRPFLDEHHDLRWIELGSEEDFNSIFTSWGNWDTSGGTHDVLPPSSPVQASLSYATR
jgi:hypothetical protein